MRKRESLTKSRLISFILALGLLLSLTITGMAASSFNVQDGLEVSISTDKNNYADTDSIKVSLTVKNTNSFSVEDVKLENLIPEGYELAQTSSDNKSVGLLKSGDTVTLDTLLIKPVNNANPSNNNSSNNTNNSNSAVNSNTHTTTKKNTASNYSTSNNKTTSTTNKAKVVYTGDNSQLLMWVGIALSSLFGIALAFWLKKKKDGNGKALLSLFLAGSLLATTLTLSSFSVKAEDSANSNVGVIEISTNASVNSNNISLDGKVTYNKEHLKNESINRYQWIKMLIEKLEYDYDAIADQPQVFEDVSEDNEYYPYVQAAALWDIIDKEGNFNGEQLATESFVGVTGVRSIGPARLKSIFQDKDNYSDNDIFAVALQNNIAMGPENSVVSEVSCADRLNNIIDFMFSDAANQDYENIVFKDSVIQLPDNYPYSENESGIMTITDVDDKTITVGDIVSFHTEDGTFLAGKVTSVSDENGKSVLQMEEVSPEEVFDRYEGVVTSELTAEMMWDYYESLSIPEEEDVTVNGDSNYDNGFQQTSFDPSKDFDVETLLNQSSDTITPTPLADIYPNDIEVKIDFSFDINEAKFKIKAAVKDLNSGITKNFNLSPDKLIKKDSFEFEEDEKDEISFSLNLKMENVKTRVATSLINATKRKPIAEVSLIGDFTFSVKGGFKGGLDIPIPGLGYSAFEESSTLTSKILNTSNVGIGLFISLNVEGEFEFSYSAPSTKITSGVYYKSGIRNYSSLKDYPPEFEAKKVVAKGEVGLKAKLEFVLMQNKKGFELKADYFAGPALKAEITAHKTYCTCVDGTMYLSLHGDATARINFGIKFNYKLEFPKIDETNPPRIGDTDSIIKVHFEDYYNTPEKDWVKVDECTYKDGSGTLKLEVLDYFESDTPIEGALISVYKNDTLVEAVYSDKDGKYTLSLPHDRYQIVVSKDSYIESSTVVDVPIDDELDQPIYLMKLDQKYVFFGSYPIEKGNAIPVPIRWRILHDDGTYYTLMMDPVLFTSEYSGSWSEASWANSDMRDFLNGDFYQEAFSSSEQSDIADTTISFWSYKEGSGYSYDTTTDKVYILSEQEYMNSDYGFSSSAEACESRIPHFNAKSAYIDATTHPGWDYEYDYDNRAIYVWTRDVHHNAFGSPEPFYVLTDGRVTYGSYTYSNWSLGIQPVLRVKITSPHVKTSSISF